MAEKLSHFALILGATLTASIDYTTAARSAALQFLCARDVASSVFNAMFRLVSASGWLRLLRETGYVREEAYEYSRE